MIAFLIPLVPIIGLSIEEIFELPICEALYFVCYMIDKNKAEEQQIKLMQRKR